MDANPSSSLDETPEVDSPVETNSPTEQDSSGTGDSQNTPRNVSLPSCYESTPLVSAPSPKPVGTTPSGESPAQQTDHPDHQSVTVDINEDQEQGTTSNGNSLPVAPEQNSSMPYPSHPEQQAVNIAFPPTTLPYPNPTTDLPYPPLGTTETPALFPEQFPLPTSNPPNTATELSSMNDVIAGDSGTTNDSPLIENEDITQGDGQMVSHGRHGLMKLPSYAGGGEYPAEPPPSYEDSNPIPVPQTMDPRQPSSAPQPGFTPPTAQLISRNFGTTPIYTICPACGEEVQTVTVHVPGALTYLMVCIFLMLGWWFMCCLIPFCVQGFKDVHHVCPNCKKTIGRYDRIGN